MEITNKLYVVATPIGNLEDITLRALSVLRAVDVVLCEDTRHTGLLLSHYKIKKKLLSYHKYNEKQRVEEILTRIDVGQSVALVSDAGMPGISDPGMVVIHEAILQGIEVEVLPGASASLTALIKSGFDTSQFLFLGFMPKEKKERENFWKEMESATRTIILYESIHRVKQLVEEMTTRIPDRSIALVRELTKLHEEAIRGTAIDVWEQIRDRTLKGECIVVVEKREEVEQLLDIPALLQERIRQGMTKSQAVKDVSQTYGISKNEVYKISLEIEWKNF